jgi:hypothetical protein
MSVAVATQPSIAVCVEAVEAGREPRHRHSTQFGVAWGVGIGGQRATAQSAFDLHTQVTEGMHITPNTTVVREG